MEKFEQPCLFFFHAPRQSVQQSQKISGSTPGAGAAQSAIKLVSWPPLVANKSQTVVGIVPEKNVLCKVKVPSPVNAPVEGGISPVKSLL